MRTGDSWSPPFTCAADQKVPEAHVWPTRAPFTVLAAPSLTGAGVLPVQVSIPPTWLPSTSVAASSVGVPVVGATLLVTVMAPLVVFPPTSTPPVLLSTVIAPSTLLTPQDGPSGPPPMRTSPLLFDTLIAPCTVLLLQKAKGAREVEVMAPVTVELMTESAAPLATVIAPFWLAPLRHVVVPAVLRSMVPECWPVMVEVQAGVVAVSPPAPWAVSEPPPHPTATTTRPPVSAASEPLKARRRRGSGPSRVPRTLFVHTVTPPAHVWALAHESVVARPHGCCRLRAVQQRPPAAIE